MIQLNHPQRQDAKPLTQEEFNNTTVIINRCLKVMGNFDYPLSPNEKISDIDSINLLQNFVNSYQNLQHFWDVVGGWDGLERIKKEEYDRGFYESDGGMVLEIRS